MSAGRAARPEEKRVAAGEGGSPDRKRIARIRRQSLRERRTAAPAGVVAALRGQIKAGAGQSFMMHLLNVCGLLTAGAFSDQVVTG